MLCNDCKKSGHSDPKSEAQTHLTLDAIAICDACKQAFWVDSGKKRKED